jgi:cyanophycin synthetase
MLASIFRHTGLCVGMTSTDGICIDNHEVASGDMTGPWSARVVLGDPSVQFAVLETARGGIVRSGLGYDWSDAAIFTNIREDHIGQDGIESVDDVLRIKRLVAERVREGGTLVLNADDPLLAHLPEHERVARLPRKVVFFSLDANNLVVQRHLADGGTAFVLKGEWIEERTGHWETRLVRASTIPATLDGTAEFQIANALAAAAAARVMGATQEQVRQALTQFGSGFGRANLFETERGYVLVDYGHNPHAIQAIARTVARWGRPSTCVLGLPGDRANSLIEESVRVACDSFHKLIIREDTDTRGRKPGETAGVMYAIAEREFPHVPRRIVFDELEAVLCAVREMRDGEVVVAFCDRKQEVMEALAGLGASQASSILDTPVVPRRTVPAA